jgi:hypothetical protein
MSVMSSPAAGLLTEIDPLPYPDRMRLLARRARALSGSPEMAVILGDLARGDRFQREIALFMAVVGSHQPAIQAALGDPDWSIHRGAVSAWLRSGPATAEVAAFVAQASWHSRRQVYRVLRRRPQQNVADHLINAVRDRFGDEEAARLLPACSAATVASLLPELGHAAGNWSALAQRHPDVVMNEAGRQLDELSPPDRARWWGRFGPGVLAGAAVVPHRVLDLLRRYGPVASLPGPLDRYASLVDADPGLMIELMAAPGRARWLARATLPRSLLRRLAQLDPATLAPVARQLRERDRALTALLHRMPPSRRAALYDAAYADTDRSQAHPADPILRVLPREQRWAETRRVLGLGPVRAEPELVLHYTAFLSWAEAQAQLAAATRRALAADRARGYELMIACAQLSADPAVVTEATEYLRRIRNEQDPVRSRALAALAEVSPRLFQPEAVPALDQLAGDALAARDSSPQTSQALSALAVAILRSRIDSPPLLEWSLRTLTRMFEHRLPKLGRLDTQLRRGQETEFFASVRDWLAAGMERGSYEALLNVTRALHRRAWQLPELQDMLGRAIDRDLSVVRQEGVRLWLADPATRSQRVEHLLLHDSSTVVLPIVWNTLGHVRTDLLDVVLTGVPPSGRFLANGVRWVPARAPAVRRWLPRQQAAYAALLGRVAADAGATIHHRTSAIAAAALVPEGGWAVVQRYVGSPNDSLAEAALAALARAGRPQEALPVLLQHAGDDRARVGIYAVGRAARFIQPGRLGPILADEQLTAGKVTSRKEALRLAAVLSVPDAGGILLRAWAQDGQHRDVRAAIVSAARQRLHDPASWRVLEEAASGSPAEQIAVAALADPFSCAERYRRRYGQLIIRACATSDQQAARAVWAALPRWVHWAPDVGVAVTTRLTDLDERSLWELALPALTALLSTGRSGSVLAEVTGELAALDRATADDDDPGRDRPARQRLQLAVTRATEWSREADPGLDRAALAGAGRQLAVQPDMTPPGAQLLLAAVQLDRGDADQLTARLTEICDLVDDQPVTAGRIAAELAERVRRPAGDGQRGGPGTTGDGWRAEPGTIRAAAARLADDGRLSAGLLAVALAGRGAGLGWPAPWRAQIRQLRAHRVPDVRTAALAVVMATAAPTGRGAALY